MSDEPYEVEQGRFRARVHKGKQIRGDLYIWLEDGKSGSALIEIGSVKELKQLCDVLIEIRRKELGW